MMTEKTKGDGKHISWEIEAGLAVITMRYGQLIGFEAYDEIESEMRKVAGKVPGGRVIVNMEGVENFTSRFIGALASLRKQVISTGGRIAICRLRPEPLRAFQVTRMDAMITVFASEEEARRAMAE